MSMDIGKALNLYLVVDPDVARGDVLPIIRSAIGHGVTCLQLRWKTATDRQLLDLAVRLLDLASPLGIPLIINDRLDIALAANAQGVHLGVDDLPVADARRLAGGAFIIGYSPESDIDIGTAERSGASYLGIGPFFATVTKPDAGDAIGAAEFSRRRALTPLPVVAIGGITHVNAGVALDAGATGAAVVSAILASRDPVEATRRLKAAVGSET
jgi:thiamine-phosphate diphosphorylase